MLHVKAVDDAGHDRNLAYRVAYLRACDALLAQLVARLWAAQADSGGAVRYALCVTGDHSTPVLFGDHSNEPVPFALAHLADVVTALGGDAAVRATPLRPIRTPEFCPEGAVEAPQQPPEWRGGGAVAGDAVAVFDEVAAAAGGLGRFCGAAVMPLLKAFAATAAET
jgi:2,3-bisphosphoglycerate-independent phosphoglycerate mutase